MWAFCVYRHLATVLRIRIRMFLWLSSNIWSRIRMQQLKSMRIWIRNPVLISESYLPEIYENTQRYTSMKPNPSGPKGL